MGIRLVDPTPRLVGALLVGAALTIVLLIITDHRWSGSQDACASNPKIRPTTPAVTAPVQPGLLVGRTAAHAPNLYFIGLTTPLGGHLRQFGIDARRIARAVVSMASGTSDGRRTSNPYPHRSPRSDPPAGVRPPMSAVAPGITHPTSRVPTRVAAARVATAIRSTSSGSCGAS